MLKALLSGILPVWGTRAPHSRCWLTASFGPCPLPGAFQTSSPLLRLGGDALGSPMALVTPERMRMVHEKPSAFGDFGHNS